MKLTKKQLREMIKEAIEARSYGGEPTHRITQATPGKRSVTDFWHEDQWGHERDTAAIIAVFEEALMYLKNTREE